MKALSWPAAFVIAVTVVTIVGSCLFLIHEKAAPPSLLAVPLAAILTGAASGAVFYLRGLVQMPPGLENATVDANIRSMSPGPSPAALAGLTSIPPFAAAPTIIETERGPIP